MNSLQQRLNVGITVSLILLFIAIGWLVVSSIEKLTFNYIESRLEHDSESVLSASAFSQGEAEINQQRVDAIYSRPFSGHYYQIILDNKTVLRSRSLWDTEIEIPPLTNTDTTIWRAKGPDNQTLHVWLRGYRKNDHYATIIIAEDITLLLQQLEELRYSFVAIALIALVLFIMIQQTIIRSSFRPLKKIQREIKALETGEVTTLTESVPTEIAPIVKEVNNLLNQLATRLQRSRTAVGNLAHALKTPLHVIIQQLHEPDMQKQPELQKELLTHTQSIEQLVELELKRARLAGSITPGQKFDPATELPVLTELLQKIYRDKEIQYQLKLPNSKIPGLDRDDMLELIGNLLDNASKWANTLVKCEIKSDNLKTVFIIEDDGPGCNDQELQGLLARGHRIDESVSGHGIGLSIVNEITDSYGATLNLEHSDLGGLKVNITFK